MLASPGIDCRSARPRLVVGYGLSQARSATVVQTIDVDKIRTGWTAFDARGDKIGDVAEIGSNYLLVVKGLFLPTDLYVPLSRVISLDEAQSTFEVNVPKEKIEAMGWQSPPANGSWDATSATESLDIPLREERSDAVRGYLDADGDRR
jgi:hypothetical protein